jgi:hypothetical protein
VVSSTTERTARLQQNSFFRKLWAACGWFREGGAWCSGQAGALGVLDKVVLLTFSSFSYSVLLLSVLSCVVLCCGCCSVLLFFSLFCCVVLLLFFSLSVSLRSFSYSLPRLFLGVTRAVGFSLVVVFFYSLPRFGYGLSGEVVLPRVLLRVVLPRDCPLLPSSLWVAEECGWGCFSSPENVTFRMLL